VTCWRRLTQWERDGSWERIWKTLIATLDAQGRLAWAQAFLAGTIVPVRRGAHDRSGDGSEADALR